ncbi:MAG: DUF2791 family P-loop domain-containing protein [Chloroflexi bacterium]|nr:DUF2791 family P-loop domain-containing protein [Chloroflexota bacterium]
MENRRAVEALRCGVPNQDAVRAMGSAQPDLEARFRMQLQAVRESFGSAKQAEGILVNGEFGSGKSHLLERFQQIALEENFVCSKIVVSKETPLYDPAKVYRAAVDSAAIAGRRGAALPEIAVSLKTDSPVYAAFYKWVHQTDITLSTRFAATLYVYEYARVDEEIRDRILRFWAGERIGVAELKKWVRDVGEAATYKVDKATVKDLALQRFFFLPRLAAAAGYSGWVLLIDEVELIGRYSLRQRARSYAEVARWMGKLEGFSVPGFLGVLSISSDFEEAVLHEKHDDEKIPNRLGAAGDQLAVSQAERGMQVIRRDKAVLKAPDQNTIREAFEKLRSIYASAYGWQPPANYVPPDPTARMRQHVKRWITEWDLMRLYPGYEPRINIGEEPRASYSEEPGLEVPSEGSNDETEAEK